MPGFLPIAILVVVAVFAAAAVLTLTHLIMPGRRGTLKDSIYESGMEPYSDTRRRFNVRFYLVAVLFLVFDVEIVFMYPWAIMFSRLADGANHSSSANAAWAQSLVAAGYSPGYMLWAMLIFFTLLTIGFIYELRKGIFRWD